MALKAMKSKTESLTMSEAYKTVAEKMELKPKDVKGIMQSLLELSTEQVKKSGSFKLAGMLNMKLISKPATKARKGLNPFTKEPCVFKAKPASKSVKVLALKKLKEALN
ncbi:Major basic nuclear protein or histone like protein [Amphidinium carterae]